MEENQAIYGIIGNPVEHSLSPVMHNKAFELLDVSAHYKIFPVMEEEIATFFEDLRKDDSSIFGLNVTVPYKETVIPFLDALSPFAEKVGAVNTIVVSEGRKLTGHNTDGPGFLSHLAELQFNPRDKKVAIMGAGGSARAIIASLCTIPERPLSIKIYNRTSIRLESLIADLGERMDMGGIECVMSIDDLDILNADLLINTTSVGLNEEDPCLVDDELLHADMLVYDLIYKPYETLLLKMAKEKGSRVANGLGMLYYQGVLALKHWADVEIDEKIKMQMRQALEEACGI